MALAGTLQAIAQVQHLARHGETDRSQLAATLKSIIITDPQNITEVYPEQALLQQGYNMIVDQLGDTKQKDVEITRYLIGILALERKLSRSNNALGMLAERISQVHRQLHHFDVADEQVISNFASIYSDVISDLGPKIQITGNPNILQRPLVQHKIRALLLAAMRSAVLWRQLGGKRRQLVFTRKNIVETAKKNITLQ